MPPPAGTVQDGVAVVGQSNAADRPGSDWPTIIAANGGRAGFNFGIPGTDTIEWRDTPTNYTDDCIQALIDADFYPESFVVLWGEADAAGPDPAGFATRARAELERLRISTGGGQNMYFVLLSGPDPVTWADVNPGMVALAASDPNVFLIDSAGIDKEDNIHYSPAGRTALWALIDTEMDANGD